MTPKCYVAACKADICADFIAFESPFGGWSNCWSSSYYPGDSLYSVPVVSNIVPVNWPAGPKKIYWFPT